MQGKFPVCVSIICFPALLSEFDVAKHLLSTPVDVKDMIPLFQGPSMQSLSPTGVNCFPLSIKKYFFCFCQDFYVLLQKPDVHHFLY